MYSFFAKISRNPNSLSQDQIEMAKSVMVDAYECVTNNFATILDNASAPEQFHQMQNFLKASPIGYALIHPESISTKVVIQIWSTAEIGEGFIKFSHAEKEYSITPDVVREALRLPKVTSFAPLYPDEEIKIFIESLGYNGDTSKLGKLVRAKLRKEWNFYFDCITKCFTNKSSNFDALTQTAQQIGFCLFQNTDFDFVSMIIEYISMRINDKRQVIYFSRFLHLIFVHLIPDAVFQNDLCIKVHKNGPRSFVDMTNKDVKNQFNTPIVYPEQFMALLQARFPDTYGARVQESTERTHPESNPSTQPKHSSKQSSPSSSSQQVPVVKRRRFKTKAHKGRGTLSDETSEESQIPEAAKTTNPDATATAVPDKGIETAGIPITQIVDRGENADKDTDSEDNMPIRFCVKRRVEDSSADVPKTPQTKRLKEVTNATLDIMGLSSESAKKRRAEGDLPPIKVYEKKRSRRSLSQSMDTQEPGTQSVPDIHPSPIMDPQEPGAQSVPDIQTVEDIIVDAEAQGTSPEKTTITDGEAITDRTAIPDEGANPDKGGTPDGNKKTDEAIIPGASTAVPEATQEPFTQSVKESQAPQEPPAQRVGESIFEAESGANPDATTRANPDDAPQANADGVPQGNPNGTEQPGESADSSGTFNWDDFDSDVGAIPLDLDKVATLPGNFKQSEAHTTAELLRRHQWTNSWSLMNSRPI